MSRVGHRIVVGLFVVMIGGALLFALRREKLLVPRDHVPWERPRVERDLDVIADDTLRVLVVRDPLTWEERPKAISGLEHELLVRFAGHVSVPVKSILVDHPDSMWSWLQQGVGDVAAAQLVRRKDHGRWVSFTRPYRDVAPVLAVLRADPSVAPKHAAVLVPTLDTAFVSPWSPFADPDYRFDRPSDGRLPVHLDPVLSPEELLTEVVVGRHSAAVVTDARARHQAGRYPVIEFSEPIGPPQQLRFAVRRNAVRLLRELDAWLADEDEELARKQYIKAYVSAVSKPGPLRSRKQIPISGDSISPFDFHFQLHGGNMPWDWELLAAMAYRESRFDSTVTSVRGAQGIMQLMPRTAERFGVDPEAGMEDHIRAATMYLNRLDTLWRRAIPDRDQRLRFMLASYNAGPGHIIDAQRLALQLGLDPDRWEHNVERTVLLLADPRYYLLPEMRNGYCHGNQVFHYVRDVLAIYRQLKARPASVSSSSKRTPEGSGGP